MPVFNPNGTEVSEVVLPDGTTASEVIAPDGTTVFSAIPDSVIDHFEETIYEDANKTLSDFYSGDVGDFSRTTSSPIEGSYSLETANSSGSTILSNEGDGLPRYFFNGEIASAYVKPQGDEPNICFAVSGSDFFGLKVSGKNNQLKIDKYVGGSYDSTIAGGTPTISKGTIYEAEVERHDGSGSEPADTKVARLYELNNDLSRSSELTNISGSDGDFTGNAGVGFQTLNTSGASLVDRYEYQSDV